MVFKTRQHSKLEDKTITEDDICTLKIRNEKGDVFILHLQRSKQVREIYDWMRKVTTKNFKLMSNFPRRAYEPEEKENL